VSWSNGLAEWVEGGSAFISVAFSWKLPEAWQRSIWYRENNLSVRVGGPALYYYPDYFEGVAEAGGKIEALPHHNSRATKASEGCPVGCYFCNVWRAEGREFSFFPEFEPRPVLIDNNLSALPAEYQDFIIEKYQSAGVFISDITSGFEPRTFTEETYLRWKKINKGFWRFAFDESTQAEEEACQRMAGILTKERSALKRVYVLIGNEPFEACYRRVMRVIEWGCEPFVMPFIGLKSLTKKPDIKFDWTEKKLKALARWCNRWIYRSVSFNDYK
jgi:hypothetical protein